MATLQAAKARGEPLRRARPSGLPRGQRRVDVLTETNALLCWRVGLEALRVGRMRVRRARRVSCDVANPRRVYSRYDGRNADVAGATKGARVFDCGSRFGRWHNMCLQNCVLSMCRRSLKHALRTRLSRCCCNNYRSGLAGGAMEARNFMTVANVLRCLASVCVLWMCSTRLIIGMDSGLVCGVWVGPGAVFSVR